MTSLDPKSKISKHEAWTHINTQRKKNTSRKEDELPHPQVKSPKGSQWSVRGET